MIGLDHDRGISSFKFYSTTRPSLFDYPPGQVVKTEDALTPNSTAVLSITAQDGVLYYQMLSNNSF